MIMQTFERTVDILKGLGAVIVDPADIPNTQQVFERGELPPEERRIMCAEFKVRWLLHPSAFHLP